MQEGVALLQLPCPELLVYGGDRPPLTYRDYAEIPEYRIRCREWLRPTIQQLIAYQEENYDYLGVIGIHESPNCSITGQRGVLMEEFFELCAEAGLSQTFLEVPTWYSEEETGEFRKKIQQFIKGEKNE